MRRIFKRVRQNIGNVHNLIKKAHGKNSHIFCPTNPTYDYLVSQRRKREGSE